MSRADEFKSSVGSNPATASLEWKSEKKAFVFYDKAKKEDAIVPLPFKFVVLKEFSTVKGYHELSNSGIYANEITFMSKEQLIVKSYKGGKIATGLWSDIKQVVDTAGGKYYKSIYVMTEKGTVVNISLKGACVSAWFEFTNDNRNRLADEWVTVDSFIDAKKGRIDYTVPTFKMATSLSAVSAGLADEAYAIVKKYAENGGNDSERESSLRVEKEMASSDDALPF